jgi:predicted RNA-binding Zn-ribbon protein involved in translation (DUF1610 family)
MAESTVKFHETRESSDVLVDCTSCGHMLFLSKDIVVFRGEHELPLYCYACGAKIESVTDSEK